MRAVILGALALSACASQPAPVAYTPPAALPVHPAVCDLPVHHHSRQFNVRLADELDIAGKGSASGVVVAEHITLQDAAENACDAAMGHSPRHQASP